MDTTGAFSGHAAGTIETFTGKAFPLGRIFPELFDIDDIAHALSLTCRYAGHCQFFYSVAEHCVRVFELAKTDGVENRFHLRAALLHDAAEAYLGDMARPLKAIMPKYRRIEQSFQNEIFRRFGCMPTAGVRSTIKRLDNEVLRAEASVVMRSGGESWDFDGVAKRTLAREKFGWSPATAEELFLEAYASTN